MNREIFFRGRRVNNREWVEGYLFDNGFVGTEQKYFIGYLVIEEYRGNACDEWDITGIDFCEVDSDTICQYTGLTDKNDKKIFEGDVVKDSAGFRGEVKFGLYTAGSNVPDTNQGFYIEFPEESLYRKDLGYWKNKVVVIGNIYDNPELFENEKNVRYQMGEKE